MYTVYICTVKVYSIQIYSIQMYTGNCLLKQTQMRQKSEFLSLSFQNKNQFLG